MIQYKKLKLGLLAIFIIGFLYCFYNYSENGRYVPLEYKTLDSRTGEIYYYHSREKICIDNFKEKKKK